MHVTGGSFAIRVSYSIEAKRKNGRKSALSRSARLLLRKNRTSSSFLFFLFFGDQVGGRQREKLVANGDLATGNFEHCPSFSDRIIGPRKGWLFLRFCFPAGLCFVSHQEDLGRKLKFYLQQCCASASDPVWQRRREVSSLSHAQKDTPHLVKQPVTDQKKKKVVHCVPLCVRSMTIVVLGLLFIVCWLVQADVGGRPGRGSTTIPGCTASRFTKRAEW